MDGGRAEVALLVKDNNAWVFTLEDEFKTVEFIGKLLNVSLLRREKDGLV